MMRRGDLMQAKDLIKLLQEYVDRHESNSEYYNMMGELEVYVDVFEKIDDKDHTFRYAGYSHDIKIDIDPANGQLIIDAFTAKNIDKS